MICPLPTHSSLPALLAAVLLAGVVACAGVSGQSPTRNPGRAEPRSWPPSAPGLPADPALIFATLPNGVRLAAAQAQDLPGGLAVALHVAAGSLSERESERGAAHLAEHLAFLGATADGSSSAELWFSTLEGGHGCHRSSAVGWHESVYRLMLPGRTQEDLAAACAWLLRLARNEPPSDAAVAAAEAQIQAELALEQDPRRRGLSEASRRLLAGSLLAQRGPLDRASLPSRSGLASWRARALQPSRLTLLVVGDLTGLDVREAAAASLGSLAAATSTEPSPEVGEPHLARPYFAVTEPTLRQALVTVARLRPSAEQRQGADALLEQLPLSLGRAVLAQRIEAAAGALALGVELTDVDTGGVLSGQAISVLCAPENVDAALQLVRRELDRALSRGFQPGELEPLIEAARSALVAAAQEPVGAAQRLDQLLAAAAGLAVPTAPASDRDLLLPALDRMGSEGCRRALLAEWERGRLSIQCLSPLEYGADAGLSLRKAWDGDAATANWAYAAPPDQRGVLASRTETEATGVVLARFANGVSLALKPSGPRSVTEPGTVLLRAVLGEGQLALPPSASEVAFVAQELGTLQALGVSAHSSAELAAALQQPQVRLVVRAEEDAFVLDGLAQAGGLQRLLELLAATLGDPAFDELSVAARRAELPALFDALARELRAPLLNDFLPALFRGDERFSPPSVQRALAVTPDDLLAWIAPQFREGPLELTLVGDLEPELALELAARTVGLLPPRRALLPRDERRVVTIARGLQLDRPAPPGVDADLVHVRFPTEDGRDARRRRALSLLALVLTNRVGDRLPELGLGRQALTVTSSASQVFPGLGDLSLDLELPPGLAPAALELCQQVCAHLADEGVTADELAAVVTPQLQAMQAQQTSAAFWVGVLGRCAREPERLLAAQTLLEDYRRLNAEQISELARQVLDPQAASWIRIHAQAQADR